jgi:hypothetical protein
MGRAGGLSEDDALAVALAIPLGFGAIDAYWPFFTTLDATFSARCLQLVSTAHRSRECYLVD